MGGEIVIFSQFGQLPIFSLAHAPIDGTTVYIGAVASAPAALGNAYQIKFARPGRISRLEVGVLLGGGTPGSAETGSMYLRINNTDDHLISSVVKWDVAASYSLPLIGEPDVSIPFTAGDYCNIKIVYPTFTTNPTAALYYGWIWVDP